MHVRLPYGENAVFDLQLSADRVLGLHPGARGEPLEDPAGTIAHCLEHPLDFPPLRQAIVPGDRVVLALDGSLPQLPCVVREIVSVLLESQIEPSDLAFVLPADSSGSEDPRAALETPVAEQIEVFYHDPAKQADLGYLAATAGGERIYLDRRIVDADFVVPVTRMGFDPLLGYRPTTGPLFPGLSDERTVKRLRRRLPTETARADAELTNQEIDEVSWLLGLQFAVKVLDGGGDRILAVSAGAIEALTRRKAEVLEDHWQFEVSGQADVVVATVEGGRRGASISDLAAAVENASDAVKPHGCIVLLTQVSEPPQAGLEFLLACEEPDEALIQLRRNRPVDCVASHQLLMAIKRAKVFLLSGWDSNLVEDLFLTPLESTAEARRVVEEARSCLFLGNAHRMRLRVKQ